MTDGNHEASDIHSRHVLPLYARIDELEEQLREAKAQTYCQICGSILGGDGRWWAMAEENERLRAEVDKHRERANDAQVSWESHRDICAQYRIRPELAAAFGTEDPVEAAGILRQMQADAEQLRAERARYKAALEEIARSPKRTGCYDVAWALAHKALASEEQIDAD